MGRCNSHGIRLGSRLAGVALYCGLGGRDGMGSWEDIDGVAGCWYRREDQSEREGRDGGRAETTDREGGEERVRLEGWLLYAAEDFRHT